MRHFGRKLVRTGLPAAAFVLTCSLALSACGGDSSDGSDDGDASGLAGDLADQCGGSADDWEALITAAQDEGSVAVNGAPDPNVTEEIPRAFEDAFGISVEYSAGGSTAAAKIATEREAGVYTIDVILGGAQTMYNVVQGGGWLDDLRSALVSPELLEDGTWVEGTVPFKDPDANQILQISYSVIPQLTVNTDEVTTTDMGMQDLLAPEWKDKIVMVDPNTGSGTHFNVTVQAFSTYGREYLEQLFDGQGVTFTSDARMAAEDVARGKYAIGIGVDQQAANVPSMVEDGLPVLPFRANDVEPMLSGGWGLLGLMKDAPHPNAAKLFANWISCPEGNKVWTDVSLVNSARADVSEESAEPPEYAQIDLSESYWDTYSWDRVKGPEAAETLAAVKEIVGG